MSDICQSHRDTITRELKRKGIYHLCAQQEEVINRRTAMWLKGNVMQHEFDPLIVTQLELRAKAKRMIPTLALGDCPLCAARSMGNDTDAIWISGFTDLTLAVVKQNNLPIRSTH